MTIRTFDPRRVPTRRRHPLDQPRTWDDLTSLRIWSIVATGAAINLLAWICTRC